jgi:hypothetical protein
MNAVYVIIENGEPYTMVYKTFESAVAVVKAKHKETIDEQLREANGYPICSDLDVPENKMGKTELYVEKGINIIIYKLPIALAFNAF